MAARLGPPLGLREPVELSHDGQTIVAERGEPLALSLLAADRLLLSRSPKLHRPRGPYCLRGACEGCLVRVNGLPNLPACKILVQGGEVVETQNVLGSRETDLLAAADFFFPQGIDHHRLLTGLPGLSPLVALFARRVAGLGKLATHAPAVQRAERLELPLLIVGGGRRGLSAAVAAGTAATLVDDGRELGGSLLALDPSAARVLARRARHAGARLLAQSSVIALSREPEDGTGRITALIVAEGVTYVARCERVLLAPGCHDAAPSFGNNDLPGVFSARAALLAWHSDVLVGSRVALVGAGRYAERLATQLSGAVQLTHVAAQSVQRAVGRERVSAIEVRDEDGTRRIKLDAICYDGPGAPSFELAVQAGASVDFEPGAGYFPRTDAEGRLAERVFWALG